ncbi:EAL domain-containing protein [Paraburkholderia domus]|uniref:EAL domain-containing protein n=1 Tax=Paraburkholderia domus TaxID=2793075 RepID=UPI0019136047|nr:EAL domain-containing protein [Paraburkholderia domus]MBK5065923.1 EAL domain-containing protein [Burkholderia sp. R-70199]CAE6964281.1 hypothetical protein R70199_07569 [Paraburkholderia domus]
MRFTPSVLAATEFRSLMVRLGIVSFSRLADSLPLCVVATVINLRQVEVACGASVAIAVRRAVLERARELARVESGFAAASGDHILLLFDRPADQAARDDHDDQRQARLVAATLEVLGCAPVQADEMLIYPAIAAVVSSYPEDSFNIDRVGSVQLATGDDLSWRHRWRSDMATAIDVFCALTEGRIDFEWDPVCDVRYPEEVDYFRAILCERVDGLAEPLRRGVFDGLERLGLIRRLDQWVVESTIEALRLNTEVRLGSDISIDSAVIDGYWASINVQLQRAPELASRLVVEISGSAAPTNFEAASQFVHYVHSLGCAVALDDVGASSTGLTEIIERSANSARIQAGYVRRASSDDRAPVRLRRLMRRVRLHTN